MIKTLLKHAICDYALTVFFDQIYDNFVKPVMSPADRIKFLVNRISTSTRTINSNWILNIGIDIKSVHGVDIEELMERERAMDMEALGDYHMSCVDYAKGASYSVGGGYKGGHSESGVIFAPYIQ